MATHPDASASRASRGYWPARRMINEGQIARCLGAELSWPQIQVYRKCWKQEVFPCGPGVTELGEGRKDAITIAFLEFSINSFLVLVR